MEGKYIPAIITLLSGLVTCIICLVKGIEIIRSLVILLIVLIVFYIVGRIVKYLIVKTLQVPFEEPSEDEFVQTQESEEQTEANEG